MSYTNYKSVLYVFIPLRINFSFLNLLFSWKSLEIGKKLSEVNRQYQSYIYTDIYSVFLVLVSCFFLKSSIIFFQHYYPKFDSIMAIFPPLMSSKKQISHLPAQWFCVKIRNWGQYINKKYGFRDLDIVASFSSWGDLLHISLVVWCSEVAD